MKLHVPENFLHTYLPLIFIPLTVIILVAGLVALFVRPHKPEIREISRPFIPTPSPGSVDIVTPGPPAAPPPASQPTIERSNILFSDPLSGPDRLVTNEYSYYNPKSTCGGKSAVWAMNSGTLLIRQNAGYSGIPTIENDPPCDSTTRTNSAVFRLHTKASSFGNTTTAMDFRIVKHGGGGAPVNVYDGVHIWSRYQSEFALYVATVSRWDGNIVIKKKVPVEVAHCSDPANDGCYYELSSYVLRPDLTNDGKWHHAEFNVVDNAAGVPELSLFIDARKVLSGTDNNVHGPAYHSGAVGVRGDNTEFFFKNFVVRKL